MSKDYDWRSVCSLLAYGMNGENKVYLKKEEEWSYDHGAGQLMTASERKVREEKKDQSKEGYMNRRDDIILPWVASILRFIGVLVCLAGVIIGFAVMSEIRGEGGIAIGIQLVLSSLVSGLLLYAAGIGLKYLARITKALEQNEK